MKKKHILIVIVTLLTVIFGIVMSYIQVSFAADENFSDINIDKLLDDIEVSDDPNKKSVLECEIFNVCEKKESQTEQEDSITEQEDTNEKSSLVCELFGVCEESQQGDKEVKDTKDEEKEVDVKVGDKDVDTFLEKTKQMLDNDAEALENPYTKGLSAVVKAVVDKLLDVFKTYLITEDLKKEFIAELKKLGGEYKDNETITNITNYMLFELEHYEIPAATQDEKPQDKGDGKKGLACELFGEGCEEDSKAEKEDINEESSLICELFGECGEDKQGEEKGGEKNIGFGDCSEKSVMYYKNAKNKCISANFDCTYGQYQWGAQFSPAPAIPPQGTKLYKSLERCELGQSEEGIPDGCSGKHLLYFNVAEKEEVDCQYQNFCKQGELYFKLPNQELEYQYTGQQTYATHYECKNKEYKIMKKQQDEEKENQPVTMIDKDGINSVEGECTESKGLYYRAVWGRDTKEKCYRAAFKCENGSYEFGVQASPSPPDYPGGALYETEKDCLGEVTKTITINKPGVNPIDGECTKSKGLYYRAMVKGMTEEKCYNGNFRCNNGSYEFGAQFSPASPDYPGGPLYETEKDCLGEGGNANSGGIDPDFPHCVKDTKQDRVRFNSGIGKCDSIPVCTAAATSKLIHVPDFVDVSNMQFYASIAECEKNNMLDPGILTPGTGSPVNPIQGTPTPVKPVPGTGTPGTGIPGAWTPEKPTPEPIHGACNTSTKGCSQGSVSGMYFANYEWNWKCKGHNGGTTAYCSKKDMSRDTGADRRDDREAWGNR